MIEEVIPIGGNDSAVQITIDSSFAVFSISCPSKCTLDTLFGIIERHLSLPKQFVVLVGNASHSAADSDKLLSELSIGNGSLLVLSIHLPVVVDGEEKAIESPECVSAKSVYFLLV